MKQQRHKMKCPFCPRMIPSEGIGRDSHIRRTHGEGPYQEWLHHDGKHVSPPPAVASSANGNGKHSTEEPMTLGQEARCPHCSGVLLILPAIITQGRMNASIIPTAGLELRNRG